MGEPLDTLDRKWRAACRVVLGQEVGQLEDYLEWLGSHIAQPQFRKSSLSGKRTAYSTHEYSEGAKWISLDEVNFEKQFEPLSINEMKDVDGVIQAVSERIAYAGNIVLGNSDQISDCSNVSDSHYMHKCTTLGDSKYMAECHWGRENESCFGCHGPGESQFMIACGESYRAKRCFEAWSCHSSSDLYYSHNLQNCSECLFSFNLKNARHAVGNLKLAADKYAGIKAKLLSEIADELKGGKKAPLLVDIMGRSRKDASLFKNAKSAPAENYGESAGTVDREFSKTAKLLLGRELSGIDTYAEWLRRHTGKVELGKSAASGREIYMVPMVTFGALPAAEGRTLGISEAWAHGESNRLSPEQAEKLSLKNAHELIGDIAFCVVDFRAGTNVNCEKCDITIDSANAYYSCSVVYSKYIGYTFWTRNCNDIFGSDTIFNSQFCINCYKSQKLSRCFELDACRDCADSYFCHNCENVRDSMFSFNAKNLSHAIGNAPLPQDKYLSVKKLLLSQIADELGKKKDLKWDIYNVGAAKRS